MELGLDKFVFGFHQQLCGLDFTLMFLQEIKIFFLQQIKILGTEKRQSSFV